jgi:hypothetical protein
MSRTVMRHTNRESGPITKTWELVTQWTINTYQYLSACNQTEAVEFNPNSSIAIDKPVVENYLNCCSFTWLQNSKMCCGFLWDVYSNLNQTDLHTAWHPEWITANFHARSIFCLEVKFSKVTLQKFVSLFQTDIEKLLKIRTIINCPNTVS